jgi:hypothetical protein
VTGTAERLFAAENVANTVRNEYVVGSDRHKVGCIKDRIDTMIDIGSLRVGEVGTV